jgi:hypothetical protein
LLLGFAIRLPLSSFHSQNPQEFCEIHGKYFFGDSGKLYDLIDVIETDGKTFGGMEYAYVCNINNLHIKELAKFEKIKVYGVTRGNVKEIPPEIASLKDLEIFQIHDQKITSLPKEIGLLTKLTTLKLGGNNLTTLPPEIGNLSNLEVLHLYDNHLTSLPIEIGNLTKLRILDLHSNKMSEIPAEIGKLSHNLHILYLGESGLSQEEKEKIQVLLPQTEIYF